MMKKIPLYLFLFFTLNLFSQSQFSRIQTIKVISNKQEPMFNIPVTLIESTTKQRISKNTNTKGEVIFEITTGKEWAVNILEMKNCSFIYDFNSGYSTGKNLITYDIEHYRRKHRPKFDRKSLKIITIDQSKLSSNQYDQTKALIKLKIVKDDDSPLKNFAVNLTSYKLEQTFFGKTNDEGIANFIVPIKTEFEIDIDGIDSFDYIDTKKSGTYSLQFTYEPTNVNETIVNDTIVQMLLPKELKATSSRIAVKLKVNKLGGNDVSKELIYLQMLGTNKIYKGKIDKEGKVSFLLPNKSLVSNSSSLTPFLNDYL